MATKTWMPNQHTPLHWLYGDHDCCLCKTESKIIELEKQKDLLIKNSKRLMKELKYQMKCSKEPDLHSYCNCAIGHEELMQELGVEEKT